MNLEEAIKHAEEIAEGYKKKLKVYENINENRPLFTEEETECRLCAEEHRQLAEWLKDYKRLLEQQPCGDAISRQSVNELVDELARAISDERCCISRGRSAATIMRDICHLPSVTPQPKMGKWLVKSFHEVFCDNCGFDFDIMKNEFIDRMKYCPNCGANMQKVKE